MGDAFIIFRIIFRIFFIFIFFTVQHEFSVNPSE